MDAHHNGPVGDGKYYIRIEGNGNPNDNETREYSDGAGVLAEKSVLDAGFLELVRLGVKAPNDPYVAGSVPETDASLATNGERAGGLADPAGDDNGPGTDTYPANPVYAPGAFDLTGLDVYSDGDNYVLVTGIAGQITDPLRGDQISHQKVNVYVGAAGASRPAAALPGTSMNTSTGWDHVVVVDGRFD